MFEQWWRLLAAGRIEEALSAMAETPHLVDFRSRHSTSVDLVGHDAIIEFVSVSGSIGRDRTIAAARTVAVRGDWLAIVEPALVSTNGLEYSYLAVIEVDEMGLLTQGIVFDADSIDAAHRALDRRWEARLSEWELGLESENAATQAWRRHAAKTYRAPGDHSHRTADVPGEVVAVRGRTLAVTCSPSTGHVLIETDATGELSKTEEFGADRSEALLQMGLAHDHASGTTTVRRRARRVDASVTSQFHFEHHGRHESLRVSFADLVEWELLLAAQLTDDDTVVTAAHWVGPTVDIRRVRRAGRGIGPEWPSQILVSRWARGHVVDAHAFDADQHAEAWAHARAIATGSRRSAGARP